MGFDLNAALGLEDPDDNSNDDNNDGGPSSSSRKAEKVEKNDSKGKSPNVKKEGMRDSSLQNEPSGKDASEDFTEFEFVTPKVELNVSSSKGWNFEIICTEIEKKLEVGSSLPDLERAYLVYCEYARCKGFSVRRADQRYFGKTSDIRWKQFNCSCTGLSNDNDKRTSRRVAVYKKLVTRTDCSAKLIVSREELGPFRVSVFERDHNHVLVRAEQSYLLRSSRNLTYAKKSVLEALYSIGIGVSHGCGFMEHESGGVQNVGFIRKDAYHHFERLKRVTKVDDGDAEMLVEYFTNKSNVEPYFFWKYQLDDEHRIMNFFFRDSRCAVDYDAFGDVISVDTTHGTNRYNLKCTPFIGMNHHSNNIMFGMAFLSDETTSTFKWLFETFLESMHGKEPKIIFTDQCRAMMNAIDTTFVNSKHRLCQWHISLNTGAHFGKLKGNPAFNGLWNKCMRYVESEEEFDATWYDMMQNYEIADKAWFERMYDIRHRWAAVFTRGIFTGGLFATSRSEVTNKVLKDVVRSSNSLYDFVHGYEQIQSRWRSNELAHDAFAMFLPGQFIPNNGLLTQAAKVYTKTIYKSFEFELANSLNVVVDHGNPRDLLDGNFEYVASSKERGSRVRKVTFNRTTHFASCSCGMWEIEGILCRHIIKVYDIKNVDMIPEDLILRRWTKKAKDFGESGDVAGTESSTIRYMTFANGMMRHLYDMVSSAKEHPTARELIIKRMKSLQLEVGDILQTCVRMDDEKEKEKGIPTKEGIRLRDPKKIVNIIRKVNVKAGQKVANKRKGKKKITQKKTPAKNVRKKRKTGPSSPPGETINFMEADPLDFDDLDLRL